jgi:hypothetical protein
MTPFNITTPLIILILFSNLANAQLSDQLKNYSNEVDPEVKLVLDYFAENNNILSFVEMQMASYVAARLEEWEIAGFYYMAAPMIKNVKSSSLVFESPMTEKGKKEIKQLREKMYAILEPLKNDKRFKSYYKNKNKMAVNDQNRDVRLKLINDKAALLKSIELYKQWNYQITDQSKHPISLVSRKSDQEIAQIFNQLNAEYLKANQDIINLLAIPGYKELRIKFIDYEYEYTKKLINNQQPDKNTIMEYTKLKLALEKIELDNALFPDANNVSWF